MRPSHAGSPARLLAASVAVVLAACSGQPRAPQADGSPAGDATGENAFTLPADVVATIDRKVVSRYPDVRALIVAVGGDLAAQRYYHGASPDDHADVSSVTATVVSMLVGIALDEGAIPGTGATVAQLLPAHVSERTAPEVAATTLEQLLSMTSGLPRTADDALPAFAEHDDWARAILEGGAIIPPGAAFSYSDAAPHLLSVIVAEATGRSTLAYAEDKLFTPLGIATEAAAFTWPEDPQGYHLGFTGLELTALDMAKLGQLYLQQGEWEGRQLVPAAFVEASTRPARVTGASHRYGYHWWLRRAAGHEAFSAEGAGGQLIQVVPAFDLVVAVSSVPAGDGAATNMSGLRGLVAGDVLPALPGWPRAH